MLVRAVAAAFAREGLRLQCATFDEVLAQTSAGDFVYLDPPYAPLSTTSAFGAYTADRFSPSDQVRLCDAVVDSPAAAGTMLLSNSSAPEIVALYRQARHAGGPPAALDPASPTRHQLARRRTRRRHGTPFDEPRAPRDAGGAGGDCLNGSPPSVGVKNTSRSHSHVGRVGAWTGGSEARFAGGWGPPYCPVEIPVLRWVSVPACESGGTGRRAGLRIRWP